MVDVRDAGARVVVRASIAPLHGDARLAGPQVSQRLSGHALEVLGQDGDWLRVRGEDAYEGWMHRGYIGRIEEFEPERDDIAISLGCIVEQGDGSRRELPLGARLWPDELPIDGDTVTEVTLAERFPRERESLATSAATLFAGAPYQWGGITPWGADCSGFVQTVFALHGIVFPRDAWQQAQLGEDAGTDPARLLAGDVLYFSDRADGRITHVGIALGAAAMAHCALGRGGFAVDVLEPSEDRYVRALVERFRFARALSGWRE